MKSTKVQTHGAGHAIVHLMGSRQLDSMYSYNREKLILMCHLQLCPVPASKKSYWG